MALQLDDLLDDAGAAAAGERTWSLVEALYPLCRSVTGDGVRATLDRIGECLPLQRTEVPSGTPVHDWEVPREWNVRDAWIADADGRRVVDFRAHNLHLMSYSVPVRRTMTLAELQPHLHSRPDRPDDIPYRTSYYREQWGFCLRHRDRERLGPGPYEVVVDSTLAPGHLSLAESVVPGRSADEVIVYTHTCHPSLANDNLSGIAVAVELARALRRTTPRRTWRFIFGPGTIGSLTWLALRRDVLPRVRAGLVLGLLGDAGPLQYKPSRRGDTLTDRAAAQQLVRQGGGGKIIVIGSLLGEVPLATSAAYNMAKAAVNHFARTLALELLPHRINVNVINPGFVDTPGERAFASEEQIQQFSREMPWGRAATPRDIGRAAAFLASDDADYITGAALLVDGGLKLAR